MEKKGIFDKRSLFFSFMTLLLFSVVAGLIFWLHLGMQKGEATPWRIQKERDLANKLKGAGLLKEAAQAYERYLAMGDPTPAEWGNVAYIIGQLYADAKEYEKALTWLYQVQLVSPDTKLSSQVGSLIVTCLERTGRYQAAEYALDARTALDPNRMGDEAKGGKIVAKIGENEIYLNEIDQYLDALPPWLKKEFSDKEKKREFAQQYIAEELLYRKGLKLGYEKAPEMKRSMERLRRQMVIGEVRRHEIEEKLSIDEADAKNYFLANMGKYKDPNRKAAPVYDEIKERVKSDYRQLKAQQAYQKLIEESLAGSDVRLFLENVE